jgi:hypothetical protein
VPDVPPLPDVPLEPPLPDVPELPVVPLVPPLPLVPEVPDVPDVAAAVFVPILPVVGLTTNTSFDESAFNPSINTEPVIATLPVNSCLSFCASPNLFEPVA